MKKKIIGNLVDIILFGIVFRVTDAVLLKVFHSESFWLELGIFLVLCTIAFGTKRGIIILWNKFVSKKKEGNENEKKINSVIWGIVLIAAGALSYRKKCIRILCNRIEGAWSILAWSDVTRYLLCWSAITRSNLHWTFVPGLDFRRCVLSRTACCWLDCSRSICCRCNQRRTDILWSALGWLLLNGCACYR